MKKKLYFALPLIGVICAGAFFLLSQSLGWQCRHSVMERKFESNYHEYVLLMVKTRELRKNFGIVGMNLVYEWVFADGKPPVPIQSWAGSGIKSVEKEITAIQNFANRLGIASFRMEDDEIFFINLCEGGGILGASFGFVYSEGIYSGVWPLDKLEKTRQKNWYYFGT